MSISSHLKNRKRGTITLESYGEEISRSLRRNEEEELGAVRGFETVPYL